jgi:hypothetical protein
MFQTRKIRLSYAVLLVLLVGRWGTAKPPQEESPVTDVQEELIGEKSPNTSPDDIEIVSRDGKRVAWRDRTAKHWVVKVNGDPMGPEFEEIEWILFSPDGKRVAYRAKQERSWVAVLDGKPGSPYQEIGAIRFSPDNQRVAYAAKKGKKWLTVLDGKEGPAYDDVAEPIFSPDSQHHVYPAKREKKWVVVVDGEEQGPEMKEIWRGDLKLGDKRLVTGLPWAYFHPEEGPIYFGRVDNGWSLIIAGVAGPAFDAVTWPVFWGGDERRYTYAGAAVKGSWGGLKGAGQVIVDSEASPVYEGERTDNPDAYGTQSALAAGLLAALEYGADRSGYEWGIGLAQGALKSFRARSFGVSSPSVSPDGKDVAYAARRDDKDYVVIRNGDVIRSFESIPCNPIFGPDGRLVYVGVEEDKLVVMADGERLSEFVWEDVDDCSGISFTEGEHLVYEVAQGGRQYDLGRTSRAKRRVFVDGEVGKEYDAIAVGNLQTRLAGPELHLAYEVHDDKYHDGASFVVVDGLEGKHYDAVMPYSLQFSGEKDVTYLARQGRKLFRVTQSLR